MDLHVYVHFPPDNALAAKINELLTLARGTNQNTETIMEGNQDILDAIAAANSSLDSQAVALEGIQADVTFLKSVVPPTGGMTSEQAQQVRDALASMTAKIAANTARTAEIDAETDPA